MKNFHSKHETDTVTSADGTTIGYRQYGSGPGVILIHGALQSSQNFAKLATALADTFSVYVPDRRGRGMSGPHGPTYCVARECEDVQALMKKTGAHRLFGLSSGALIALQAALTLPGVDALAIHEPPLVLPGSSTPWLPRVEGEVASGKLAATMTTMVKVIGAPPLLSKMPRFFLEPFFAGVIRADVFLGNPDAVTIRDVIPTLRHDMTLVSEMRGPMQRFDAIDARILLMVGGATSGFLHQALDELSAALPQAARVELAGTDHLAPDNSGKPAVVAEALREFFDSRDSGRVLPRSSAERVAT